jgi:acyl-CoA thioesterase-2
MGGYVAAIALRAAGLESPFARPASFFCHYLGVGAFEDVALTVTVLRQARTAAAHRVVVTQGERPILDALVWSVGEVEGLEHHPVAPAVPLPATLPSFEDLFEEGSGPPFPFWNNVEGRPLNVIMDWPPREPLEPVWRQWSRFRPRATFEDPWVDAARSVILIDVQSWPSGSRPHVYLEPSFIAPSLDLYVAFCEPAPEEEWLLCDGYSPSASDGLMGWTGQLWARDGRLVAYGGGQGLFRRVPPS